MTEEKYFNAINEYLFLINSLKANSGDVLSKEVFSVQSQSLTSDVIKAPSVSFMPSMPTRGVDIAEAKDHPVTPTSLKRQFLTCSSCPFSTIERVLGEGVEVHPQVIVITDTVLGDSEREYLDVILKTIHLNPESNTYITSLLKCKNKGNVSDEHFSECSKFLKMQFTLYSPLAAIGFGVRASNFLRSLKENGEYKHCAFIYTRMPFELKDNVDAKRKVWESFKKLAVFLNLPRL